MTINFTDIVSINSKCATERAVIMRNWTITDESGNTTVCNQRITIEAFDIFSVEFPSDWDDFDQPAFNCMDVAENPSLTDVENTGRPMIDGNEILVNEMPFCDVSIGYEDYILDACGGSYEIMRVWAVSSACMPYIPGVNPRIHYQRVMVWDMDAPEFTDMDDVTISTRPNACAGDWIIEAPSFEEDCSGINWYISVSAGFITVDPISGLAVLRDVPAGTHTIRYIAHDECGYYATAEIQLHVIDDVVPIAICDQRTRVSLGHDGIALVHVSAWDDGSYDNCGILDITARRKVDSIACGNTGDWEESLMFCCEDADINGIGVVEVEVRVRDEAGNENFCWVNVEVEDKLRPQLTCPADVTVNCAFDLDLDNLEVFGRIAQPQIGEDIRVLVIDPVDLSVPAQIPVQTITDGFVVDNCGIESITETNVFTLNPQCGNVGTDPNPLFQFRAIQRRFAVVDQFGNSANCQQDIYILENTVPFDGDDIVWPRDITLMECGSSSDDFAPANLGQFGVVERDRQPSWSTISCSKPAVSYQDQVFTLVDSACFKILRSWKVIDWCNHNPNTGQGEWTHVQVIYIQDTQAPVCNNCVDQVFVDESSTDCTGFAELVIDVSDCTPTDMLVATWEIDAFRTGTFDISGSGLDASGNYPFGTHTIRWTVYDLCSNTAVFEYDFEVVDGKLPTPVCLHGITTVIMPVSGCVELNAELYDAGSFDNCTASEDLIFSWSSDPEDTEREFCCEDLGTNVVEIWVTDEAGNQDFCITYIQIQDPENNCDPQSIAGNLTNEYGEEVEEATVELEAAVSGDLESFLTGNNGYFLFNNLTQGEDYTVTPHLDKDPLNGVTTYDIALIQRHILGIQYLESPYKLIAADVRPDGVINVLDIADLRSLILGKTSNFAQNTSWRFVSTDQQFAPGLIQPPANIEEDRVYEDFNASVRGADFVGVKIGDVNGSAQPNSLSPSIERRTGEVIALQIEEGMYRTGEQISVEINAANFHEIVGYQFTFEFDNSRLDFAGFESGVLEVTDNNFGFQMSSEGVITTSWNSMKAENASEDDVLFVLNFTVRSDIRATDAFRLSNRITKTEAYRMGGEILDMDLRFTRDGQIVERDVFALYQNQPNPFNGQTIIGFVLPADMEAEMSIFDVTGRLIYVISGEYAAGYNEIRLLENDLPASGVYYYQLEAEGYSATKRMVLTGN
ncbi:MAG: T9SS C-terminal target domain-containing protein [Saprospirales bacterium]|nr:MAG: T9SS C-terminal target domain-containing protein [Saprospirales bacterium]